ncbi:transporter [Paraburkholderia sp. J67]|uniref:SphA family protein n=1 Tax=Paraburkholderia sp. J67 TaxID=2805435 RepID=UPI002ABE0851|nr:transporter [Paraburkholderia sp. J67]
METNQHAKSRVRKLCRAVALACAMLPFASQASTYQPAGIDLGATTFNDAFGSVEPGWTTIQLLQYENNNHFYTNTGSQSPAFKNAELHAFVWLPQLIYTSPLHFLGGALGLTALLPVTSLNSHSDEINPYAPTLTARSGFGDITFGPFLQFAPIISGGRPVFVQRFEFDVIAPTGAYDPNKLVNPGSGFWSLNPYWSATFLPTAKTEVSVRLHYLYNLRNDNPGINNPFQVPDIANFQAGQAVWANFAASYKVLPNVEVGINGFYFRQITDDRVNGQSQSAARTTNLSLGPGAEWAIDRSNFVFANLYLPVVERNTYSGVHVNLRWIHAF